MSTVIESTINAWLAEIRSGRWPATLPLPPAKYGRLIRRAFAEELALSILTVLGRLAALEREAVSGPRRESPALPARPLRGRAAKPARKG